MESAEAGFRATDRGATILQLRSPNLVTGAFEREASRLVATVAKPVIVSSRCDVAIASRAAGVNLPERDIPTRDARALLGDRLVGRSVHSLEAAIDAERDGANYVIFGPIWPSPSHPDVEPVGVAALAQVSAALHIPVLAIGGVTEGRIADCIAAGAAGYAGVSIFK
ncbi:MAG TPA: thiamine phosphate synthase [Candidatus Dormibacteraeota bacterium]|nr:thiamine phosphate synthase [Candidatus Dormibacteraeota bacterium]